MLFTIPRKSIINVETSALRELLPALFEEAEMSSDEEEEEEDDDEDSDEEMGSGDEDEDEEPRFDSWSSLILILIYEHLSPSSAWKPYLDVLPNSFNTPMFWDAAELQHLQASATVGKIGKAQAERMFTKLIIPAVRANPKVFAGAEKYSDDDLIALAHRMGSTIMAYAFDLENEDNEEDEEDGWVEDRDGKALMGMVPMADMMNADAEFNVNSLSFLSLVYSSLANHHDRPTSTTATILSPSPRSARSVLASRSSTTMAPILTASSSAATATCRTAMPATTLSKYRGSLSSRPRPAFLGCTWRPLRS